MSKIYTIPTSLGKRSERHAERHFVLGLKAKDDISLAEHHYKLALGYCYGFREAHVNLGTIYYNRGQTIQALRCYQEAVNIDPDYSLAHYNIGLVLWDLGQLYEAEKSFRMAIKVAPKCADAHYNLALLLQKIGNYAEAAYHWILYTKFDRKGSWYEAASKELAKIKERMRVPDKKGVSCS